MLVDLVFLRFETIFLRQAINPPDLEDSTTNVVGWKRRGAAIPADVLYDHVPRGGRRRRRRQAMSDERLSSHPGPTLLFFPRRRGGADVGKPQRRTLRLAQRPRPRLHARTAAQR